MHVNYQYITHRAQSIDYKRICENMQTLVDLMIMNNIKKNIFKIIWQKSSSMQVYIRTPTMHGAQIVYALVYCIRHSG